MYTNKIKQERMIFTENKWEQMIFTVHELEQMILRYTHYQDLSGNDWEMTKNEWEILFMTFNNLNRPFSLAIHEQLVVEWDFLKQSYPAHLCYHPILSCPIPFIS